ncbi:MAG: glutamate-1-semialdehyde 2,1-aminomutase [Sedimentisphaerales bacterium]|nr:glutamate-1-semialdehyde 2,1-aminomutase [Sedimentisphaerales bacterium]
MKENLQFRPFGFIILKSNMSRLKRYSKSAKAYARACQYLVGGVNSPVRAFDAVGHRPLFIHRAKGSKIYDIDGNKYIDYVGSWGPMILGHGNHKVLKAIKTAADNGTSFGAPTLAETELARRIINAFSSIEKVRLLNSGTEAAMTAVRLGRAFTGRDLIIKMSGCYHGHCDSMLAAAGSGLATYSIAGSAGVPDEFAKLTVVVPYNDIAALEDAFNLYKRKIAAVIVEPVAANMGVVPPAKGYLDAIRNLCSQNSSVLIFDEVITGFRLAPGGAQQLFGMQADLTCLGKIAGGGLPAAALGGRAEIMDMLAPIGPVYQAGTLSGNPVAVAAANTTLSILTEGNSYERLDASAAILEKGFTEAAEAANVALTINRVSSIMSCFFLDKPVKNFTDVQSADSNRFKRFFAEMLKHNIYLAPSPYEAIFLSLAHTKEDIEETIDAAYKSMCTLTGHNG